METELSFKNNQLIKNALITRMDHQIEMDELMQGAIGSNGKGCTVWCALNNGELKRGYDHSAFPDVLGLPEWLARLHDVIFEGLTPNDSKWFSKEWVRAIPVGKDLTPIKWKFTIFLLKENLERVLSLKNSSDELKNHVANAIRGSLAVNESALSTGVWDESAAESARSAAWLAAESAAESAAEVAEGSACSAARSAARSADWSVRLAWSARSARLRRSVAYKKYAQELLSLFSELL